MLLKLGVPASLCNFIFFSFPLFLSPLSAVKIDGQSEQRTAGDSSSGQFPISYPQIKYANEEAYVEKPSGDDRCLFYAEGLSVIVFAPSKSQSAWAEYRSNGKEIPRYTVSLECQRNMNLGSSFDISLKVDGKADGFMKADIGKESAKNVFTVEGVEFILHFNFTQVAYWQLVGATVNRIAIKGTSEFLNKNLNVENGWTLDPSVIGSTNINGFKDYSYACGRTSAIVWTNSKGSREDYAVGITLNNVQFQPFNATFTVGGKEADRLKFGWKVNDCQGLFNIGTWMGLVVATLLIGVLIFGFLMLNSVQTMDRFDDPKQKQLIVSSKE